MSSPQNPQPTYLGCFRENIHSPDLTGEPPSIIARAEACFTHCSIGTWTYAAIRNRTICTCGDSFNKYGNASASACSTACPEDQSAFDDCGGPEANSVYSVAPITPKPPLPHPSINPNVTYPTPPSHPDSNANDSGPLSKISKTTVISSALIGVAVLAVGIMSLMVYRKRRNKASPPDKTGEHRSMFGRQGTRESGRSMDDDRSATSTGQTWFSMGHRNRSADPERGGAKDMGAYQAEVTTGAWAHRNGELEKQLFEGFESSAIMEDHSHEHRSVHPLDSKPEGHGHSFEASEILDDRSQGNFVDSFPTNSRQGLGRQDQATNTGIVTLPKSASFASKIGQKLSHLRVKTHLLPPGHHLQSAEGLSAATPQVPPISPISPISPASSSSSSPTTVGFGQSSWEGRRASDHEAGLSTGGSNRRDSANATPSFSLATSPAPGTACNRRTKSMPKDSVPEVPLLERLSSRESSGSRHSMDHQLEPLSPISPTHRDHISQGASQVVASHGGKHSHHQDYRYQKQQRSNLIKDLILQGDSALEDKEQAMMAQYQPHHCRQQQQQQQQQQQMLQSQHYATHGPAGSRLQHRRSSSSATSKSMQGSKTDQKSVPVQIPSEVAPSRPDASAAADPSLPAAESLLTVPPHHEKQRRGANIPMIDTNYLAPPPRILIHKAL